MHVVDVCFWPLPLTTTQNDVSTIHKKVRGPTSVTEYEETDKDEKIVLKKGYSTLFFC